MREGDGAAQQARVADRLDRGDFGVQRREKTLPIYHCGPFQPAANAQAVNCRIYRCGVFEHLDSHDNG